MADALAVVDDEARTIGKISERSRYTFGWSVPAKRYSRPLGKFASVDHRILGNESKSGLTPREDYSESNRSNKRRNWKETSDELERYQTKTFDGFTAFDLHTVKCLVVMDTDIFLHSLRNTIHPCFEKSKLVTEDDMPKHKGAIPILGDEKGFWMADNLVVRSLLKPCLQLVTMIFHSECKYSWLNTLLNDNAEGVPRSIKGIKLQRSFSRTHGERISRSSPSIQNITSKVIFGFRSGCEDIATGLPRSRTSRNAITRNHIIYDRIEVLVSTETENRLRIATTLVYEFAIWGDQPVSLMTQMYNCGGPGLPNLGIIKTSWFIDKNKTCQTDKFHTYGYWLVPTQWYSSFFTEGFWENVREFGPEAKRIKIEKRGVRYLSKDHPDAKYQIDDVASALSTGGLTDHLKLGVANNVLTRISKQHGFETGSHDPVDYLNIKPPIVTHSCPRWNDITENLFSNRGPLDLALDTMELLSEPTLFRWEPFPGFGIVKRIATGWPPPIGRPDSVSCRSPIGEPDEEDMETLDNLMSDEAVQEALYEYCATHNQKNEMDGSLSCSVGFTNRFGIIRLGSKNIVRLIYPVEEIRAEKADAFTTERMRAIKERAEEM
ncbi:uncharacterized protein Bfra_004026 [Botrytis fragariae]|uniref:Uncharacterized protein n=1 Tax=Botrytis fragariae TaxID=1964551 RepID=A0A8H6AXF2_9HELO|nr:uncharacterized protein Bfra_004026 [Botrytis fragariae]KAF5875573.1 hypothetical protein Bfra_004026 [Botrytis fragariae]